MKIVFFPLLTKGRLPLFYSLSYVVMHTIEIKEIIPVIIPVAQFWSREHRKLHFGGSNFTNFPGGHAPRPRTPLGFRASGTQRRERCTSTN